MRPAVVLGEGLHLSFFTTTARRGYVAPRPLCPPFILERRDVVSGDARASPALLRRRAHIAAPVKNDLVAFQLETPRGELFEVARAAD